MGVGVYMTCNEDSYVNCNAWKFILGEVKLRLRTSLLRGRGGPWVITPEINKPRTGKI
jgi:hypothetical protein